ncbi:G-type lectin S-receptor-like serine/threonine-protein kinase At4g03230 [Macadamia integrifolia]|uniref:G-type lectin S-receptor-like serine/threonine-protein kinase At4g03230 n=1 Tax=Macadamia integrifolia TaxID=60698 RepID=UPI001C4E6F8F|nr:G-type lectin S-receptor-like serine/threonine-protein kinase At4g03230 [Macadamia integrifolia]
MIMGRRRRRVTRRVYRWSLTPISFTLSVLLFLLSSSALLLCTARDAISLYHKTIRDGETIISSGEKFEFGFFSPDGAKRYVGIWYHKLSPDSKRTVVWVANGNNPVKNSRGNINIEEDGNLQILDEKGINYWSTRISKTLKNPSAKLMDSGNLILSEENATHEPIWQSFSEVSNTFLPGMKMDTSKVLQSWTSELDPTPGDFRFKLEGYQLRYAISNGSLTYWRSSSWKDFSNSNDIPKSLAYVLLNFTSTSKDPKYNNELNPGDFNNTRLVMEPSGKIMFYNWSSEIKGWHQSWFEPSDNCSIYNICGPYGICSRTGTANPICKCLKGFKATSQEDWNSGEFSEGCMRRTQECKDNIEFLSLNVTKVENPTAYNFDANTKDKCREECLSKCACVAFYFEPKEPTARAGRGDPSCKIWMDGDLKDLQEEASIKSQVIFIRVAHFDLEPTCNFSKDCEALPHSSCMPSLTWNGTRRCICDTNHPWDPSTRNCTQDAPKLSLSSHNEKPSSSSLIIKVTVAVGVIIFSCAVICIFYLRRRVAKRKACRESIQESSNSHFDRDEKNASDLIDTSKLGEDQKKGTDVPFFDFEIIVSATENFSDANKLGQGGFGHVYKGRLKGGQEIAVKRLSRISVQGIDEFKNEVLLIAKLQHRNLVRLIGYSIKGDEKMLLYEYMPNKSLDSFIFDRSRCLLLNWEMRFNIIMGISRGLLYLHQDSRLRIIHRDLKTSNILLDEEMNPKISDFGLARIFGGNQTEASTNRVVGTYGYMSPEYALDGFFSVKSDVFSFGVVLLEIISGKKNTGFYQSEHSLSLLGYAWELWRAEKVLDFVDKSLYESCNVYEVSKCINVGLLCVQEDAYDRPTMSNVIFMLGSDTATLPTPKQPAYIARKCPSSSASSSRQELYSINEMTISVQEGR